MVRSRPGALAVVAGTLLLALGACSQAGNSTVAAPPVAATTPGAAGATSGAATLAATTPPAASPSPASPSVVITTISGNTYMFVTPSGNIGCAATTSGVRCDIGDRSWTAPKSSTCRLDYGNGVFVGPNGAGMTCAGDTLLHATTTVLAYGHGVRVGQILCVSQSTGMRCDNESNGHGFTLAKEAYTLF